MRLKFLAISDAHLGETTSLLSYPEGVSYLADVVRDHLGGGGKASVETLLFLGDVPERSHARPEEMLQATHRFVEMLAGVVDFEKVVYMPGNHDHVLWTNYCRRLDSADHRITPPAGEPVVTGGARVNENGAAGELLSVIFEHPDGPVWREVSAGGRGVVFANPLYAESFAGRTYVFTHGTHFRKEVTSPRWLRKILDLMVADGLLGDLEIHAEGDVREAKDLEELERLVAPLIDGMLPPAADNPLAKLDEAGYVLAVLSGRFGLKRQSPEESRLYAREELTDVPEDLVANLTSGGSRKDSVDLLRKFFLPHVLDHLREYGFPAEDLTFVYGDTHDGGWGEVELDNGREMRLYNTGGWITYDLEDHPTCYLFAVDEAGAEYFLDVSFKEAEMNGNPLLRSVSDNSKTRTEQFANAGSELLGWARKVGL